MHNQSVGNHTAVDLLILLAITFARHFVGAANHIHIIIYFQPISFQVTGSIVHSLELVPVYYPVYFLLLSMNQTFGEIEYTAWNWFLCITLCVFPFTFSESNFWGDRVDGMELVPVYYPVYFPLLSVNQTFGEIEQTAWNWFLCISVCISFYFQ